MCVCVSVGGTTRASGMLLHYKPMGSQEAQQLRLEATDDKKAASLWLTAMHKVRSESKTLASAKKKKPKTLASAK